MISLLLKTEESWDFPRPLLHTSALPVLIPWVQWLRLGAPNAGAPGLVPDRRTKSHKLQLRVHMLQLGDPAQSNKEISFQNKTKLKSLIFPKSQVKQKELVFFRVYRK